jgi:uncharacterized protein YoxC
VKLLLIFIPIVIAIVYLYLQITSLEQQIDKLYDVNYNLTDALNRTVTVVWNLSTDVENNKEDIKNLKEHIDRQDKSIYDLSNAVKNLTEKTALLEVKAKQKGIVDPPYSELVQFIVEDRTDAMTYINNSFVCTDFANMFIANFKKKGYYSCLTELVFEDGAHAIVAVNTTDRGLLYVEPQSDGIITSLKVGDNYCSKVDWNCYWEIKYIKSCFSS